jgi:AbrB family looped-hinge helix DNA binding protein
LGILNYGNAEFVVREVTMSSCAQVNQRGGVTLPKAVRKRLGIDNGGVVMFEESAQGILLKSAVSFPIEMYSDTRVAEFDDAENDLKQHLSKK